MTETTVAKINSRGQITIPSQFRKKYRIDAGSKMFLTVRTDGRIEILPFSVFGKSSNIDDDPELFESAVRAYLDGKDGKLLTEAQVKDLLNVTDE